MKAKAPQTFAVVVCTHSDERLHLVEACVASVLAGERQPDELVVVVDSNPDLRALLSRVLPAAVDLVESGGKGISAARNAALNKTSADVVCFVDDDAHVDRRWLHELAEAFEQSPDTIGLGGRIEPDWDGDADWLPPELWWVVGCTYRGHPDRPQPITRPIGCNMAFRRDDTLESVGGFPTDFGPVGDERRSHRFHKSHSNEELALALSLRKVFGAGGIHYCPTAIVHHHVPADRVTWRYLVARCKAEGLSKADVLVLFRGDAMNYDRQYVREVLAPAVVRYLIRGLFRGDGRALRFALRTASGAFITAIAYGRRRIGHVLSPRP